MSDQTYDYILLTRNGPVATLAFNRPRVLNAFNNELGTRINHDFWR